MTIIGRLALAAILVASCGGASTPGSTTPPTAAVTNVPTRAPTARPTPAPVVTVPPTPAPTIPPFVVLSDRDWAKVLKDPDAYNGDGFQLWACVTQFDAATGNDTFRADVSNKKQSDPSFDYSINGSNAFFVGLAPDLTDIVQDDVVFMDAIGGGSFTYDTTAGGSMTVPLFAVFKISRKGSCA